ncbi:unnamed protein product [Ixodes pacificus]
MVPSFIILTATSRHPRHLPLRTTPNCPLPSSSRSASSEGSISHLSCPSPAVGAVLRKRVGQWRSLVARPPLSWRWYRTSSSNVANVRRSDRYSWPGVRLLM